MRITKKVRRAAIELLSACACESAQRESLVWLAEIASIMFRDSGLDLYESDLVMQVAATTWRGCSSTEPYPQTHVETYVEAEYKLRDGFTPNLED